MGSLGRTHKPEAWQRYNEYDRSWEMCELRTEDFSLGQTVGCALRRFASPLPPLPLRPISSYA